jgi:hypothetical protein
MYLLFYFTGAGYFSSLNRLAGILYILSFGIIFMSLYSIIVLKSKYTTERDRENLLKFKKLIFSSKKDETI